MPPLLAQAGKMGLNGYAEVSQTRSRNRRSRYVSTMLYLFLKHSFQAEQHYPDNPACHRRDRPFMKPCVHGEISP